MNDDQLLTFEDLNVSIGQKVEILPKSATSKEFSEVLVIGALVGQSVIISAPESGVFPKIEEGEDVVFRVMLADGIAIFAAQVLFISDVPAFMVYVDYPTDIRFKRVRNAARVSVTLPILASNLTNAKFSGVAGRLTDISMSGAGLILSEPLGSKGDRVSVKGKFSVGDIQRMLSLEGVVRAAKRLKNGSFVYGVEFTEDDENDAIVLSGFISNAMALGKTQKIR